ncbi:Uma2 family endonuclease [Thermus caldifontis]|uniref:Uma2 family endonuclease n=1 Tax=Thermus caldifontis TaxID=1930763 RepID=UPI000DF4C2D2|nr:Uma2 family endonuclease [Thermus caldifontis]
MLAPKLPKSLEAYLEEEAQSPVKREYLRGRLYAMAGASALHNRVALNVAARFLEAARPRGCWVYMSDMKLGIRDEAVYYPDVMVVCRSGPPHPYYEEAPCALVEVLSPATEAQDRREKRVLYETLESLEVYLLVDPEARRFTLYRRTSEGFVEEEGEEAPIPCLDLVLRAEEAFRL